MKRIRVPFPEYLRLTSPKRTFVLDSAMRIGRQPGRMVLIVLAFVASSSASVLQAQTIDINEAYRLYDRGKYQDCISACEKNIPNAWRVDWRILKIRSEIRLGRYKESLVSAQDALKRHTGDIRIRWEARQAFLFNNDLAQAGKMLIEIDELVKNAPWRYSDAEDRIVLGRMMLQANADAKQVLELFFDAARKIRPDLVDNYLVAADLALSKSDFDLAARETREGLKRHPEHADLHFRLARALWSSDRPAAVAALEKTLELNPIHFEAILFQADKAIDGEQYEQAIRLIDSVLKVNARHPPALAHRAIIAHLQGDFAAEKEFRKQALASWSRNPEVDYTLGKKLSQKYRFREGAVYQRKALEFDPDFVPAKIQLAQDLLRLGQDEEGWKLVAHANQLDQYNILMHNLQTLHDQVSAFASLEAEGIIVRMDKREAAIYGPEVLELLVDAKKSLTRKYDYQFDRPVIVEIFPRQEDFAIRTFGIPGGAGFLGVCFGHLITANSPASQGDSPTNWQSVLWHEFCHAVTLGKTNNRMPRWLSEGISVYEERLRNPGSGERITPAYWRMMVSDDLTPVSQLSAAFLGAKSPAHLQFAYYESSLVVEYLVEKHGLETLKSILVDLGAGIPINETLQRHSGSLDELDEGFRKYALQKAQRYAANLDFSETGVGPTASIEQIRKFLARNPNHFSARIQLVGQLMKQESWDEARELVMQLMKQFPPDRVHPLLVELLAEIYRKTGDEENELRVLKQLPEVGDDQFDGYLRLAVLLQKKADWSGVRDAVQRAIAINPLVAEPYRLLATAGEKLSDRQTTLRSLERLLEFESTDLALTHYRMARVQLDDGRKDVARRHLLLAIEEAPRYREALRMLLHIEAADKSVADEKDP